jgi:hypothetical protein
LGTVTVSGSGRRVEQHRGPRRPGSDIGEAGPRATLSKAKPVAVGSNFPVRGLGGVCTSFLFQRGKVAGNHDISFYTVPGHWLLPVPGNAGVAMACFQLEPGFSFLAAEFLS